MTCCHAVSNLKCMGGVIEFVRLDIKDWQMAAFLTDGALSGCPEDCTALHCKNDCVLTTQKIYVIFAMHS